MSHPDRADRPGKWHHVMNRGIARRTMFESERDIRFFLSRLARLVRDGLIEVHAFCILTTHFHMLVRSPRGELSLAMQRLQNEYSRWFNRSRRRDGPLYRSRFTSKPVDTLEYRYNLVRYIDANSVQAGLVEAPQLYPHGSASSYACERGPPWLARDWVEAQVKQASGRPDYDPGDYTGVFGGSVSPRLARLIEKRMALAHAAQDPLDDLLGAAPDQVRAWMRRKAKLADGTVVGMPVCDPDDVDGVVTEAKREHGDWTIRASRKSSNAWIQAHVALLRDLTGATWVDAARRSGVSTSAAWHSYAKHQRCLDSDESYAVRMGELASAALAHAPKVPAGREW
jgi:REP element-mobilizing transposase RayT